MQLTKSCALALAIAALAVPVASAEPGHGEKGKGTPPASGPGCNPAVLLNLQGTLTSKTGAMDTSFTLTVTKANEHGQAYFKAGTATVNVEAKTKSRRHSHASLADLALGDKISVQARACLADLASGATPALTARKVEASRRGRTRRSLQSRTRTTRSRS